MNRAANVFLALVAVSGILISGCNNTGSRNVPKPIVSAGGTGGGGSTEEVTLDGATRTVERGDQTARGLVGPDEILAIDEVSWAQIYALHAPNAPLPAVDFSREVVVGAFLADENVNPNARSVKVVRVEPQADTGDIAAVVRHGAVPQFDERFRLGSSDNRYEFVAAAARSTTGRLLVTREVELPFGELDSGRDSAFGQGDPNFAGTLVALRSQQELDAFLAVHGQGLSVSNDPLDVARQAPLDFSRQMVVAAVAASGAASVKIQRIVQDEQSRELRVLLETRPESGQAGAVGLAFAMVRTNNVVGNLRAEQREGLVTRQLDAGIIATSKQELRVILARNREPFEAFWRAIIGTPVPAVDFDSKQVLIVIGAPLVTDVNVRSVTRVEHDELFVDIQLSVTDAVVPGEEDQTSFVALEVDRSAGSFSTLVEQFPPFPGG